MSAALQPAISLPHFRIVTDDLASGLSEAHTAITEYPYAAVVSMPALAQDDDGVAEAKITEALAATYRLLAHGIAGQSRVAWPIGVNRQPGWASPRNNIAGQAGPASLHTDVPAADDPDRYIAMYCIRPCALGGGQSLVMPIDGITANLGVDDIATLAGVPAPFATDVFATDGTYTHTVCRQPVFFYDATRIRYRHEMLRAGIELEPPEPTLAQALARLQHILASPRAAMATLQLHRGQMLLLDNTRCLHGRTAFRDTSRYLLRWRLDCIADHVG